MLQATNLTITMKRDGRRLIDGFSFKLRPGDKAAMIGEEGNGKSTLLRVLCGERTVLDYASVEGELVRGGAFAYLPQFFERESLSLSVAEYIGESDIYSHAAEAVMLGLDFELLYSERAVSSLSGGERVKLALFKLICAEPDAFFLDEPSNDLDLSALDALGEFISRCAVPVVFISHDGELVERTANVVIHIEQLIAKTACKVTVARMRFSEYAERRSLGLEKQTRIALKQREEHAAKLRRWQHIYDRVDHEQRTISRADPAGGRLLKKKMKSLTSQRGRLERERDGFEDIPDSETGIIARFDGSITLPAQKRVLELRLSELKAGERTLARNIELTVSGGAHVGIVGRNGAGKSTLLGVIYRKLKERTDITVGYMPQNYSEVLDFSLTPLEYFRSVRDKATATRALTMLGSLKFTAAEMNAPIGELSGGQQAKIIFSDMVLTGANVLVLDEPTRNFSPLSAPVIRSAVAEFAGAVISVSHDKKYLDEACNIVYELGENGLKLL